MSDYEKRITTQKAKKFDNGKADLSLLPESALKQAAYAFMYGAEKYGRYNYLNGIEVSRLIAAALRHINSYNEGNEIDPESGAKHLGHAIANLSMIIELAEKGKLIDNRYNNMISLDRKSGAV